MFRTTRINVLVIGAHKRSNVSVSLCVQKMTGYKFKSGIFYKFRDETSEFEHLRSRDAQTSYNGTCLHMQRPSYLPYKLSNAYAVYARGPVIHVACY